MTVISVMIINIIAVYLSTFFITTINAIIIIIIFVLIGISINIFIIIFLYLFYHNNY